MFDAHANLASAPVAVAPSPALSGTSLIITTGYAALFPAVPFNCTVTPAGVLPTQANSEIIRVTNIVGDIFTIVRAQEGTTAKAIASGWTISNTVSAKVFTDIENQAILSISAGTTNATGNQVVFSNSNGVTFGAAGSVITASFSGGGGGGGGAAISAGANSQSTGTVVFSASNGVTFGLSNNGVMTASHDGITAQTTQPVAASASNGSFAFSTLEFADANGVTFGTSAGGIITASVGTAAGGNSVNISAGTESANLGSVVFSNSNGVSFGLDAGTVTASHDGLTSQSNQAFSAQGGSSAFQTLGFSNTNGITFSNSNGSVVASHDGLTSQSAQAASASNGSFAFQTLAFSNANNVTFGTSAGGIITASVAAAGAGSVNFSAGTQSADLASIVFSNSNGVSFGLSNGTITASASGGAAGAVTLSSFFSPDALYGIAPQVMNTNTVSSAGAFLMPQPISFDYARFMISVRVTQSNVATIASASASASAAIWHTINAAIYSFGTGANSNTLQMVASGSAGSTFSQEILISNSTEGSYSQGITAPLFAGTTTQSVQYSISNTVYSFSTNEIGSLFSGVRAMDVPFNTTLPAGNYWLLVGLSSSSDSGGPAQLSGMSRAQISMSAMYLASQSDLLIRELGINPTTALPTLNGAHFSFLGGFTESIDFASMIRAQSNNRPYFQLLCTH